MAGTRRIALDVTTQADNKVVDGARVRVFMQVPYLLEDFFSRDRAAAVSRQVAQQLGFHQCQLEYLGRSPQLHALEVEGLAVKLERIRFERRRRRRSRPGFGG